MSYSTFLFDLDHTLFDTDKSEELAFVDAMAAAEVPDPTRYLRSYQRINLELWARVESGEMVPDQVRYGRFERLVEEGQIDADPLQLADDVCEHL